MIDHLFNNAVIQNQIFRIYKYTLLPYFKNLSFFL